MNTLSNTDGFVLHGWMVNELHLQGGDLIAFALVHQFTQSNAGLYKGNTAYLSAWTGWTTRCSRQHLSNLAEKGLIEEVRGSHEGKPFCYYKLGKNFIEPMKKFHSAHEKKAAEPMKKFQGRNYNIESTSEFTPPTPKEVMDYVRARGWIDPEGFAAYYCSYHAVSGWRMSNGKKITNWKLNVVSWEPNNKTRTFSTPKAPASPAAAPGRQMTAEEYQEFIRK